VNTFTDQNEMRTPRSSSLEDTFRTGWPPAGAGLKCSTHGGNVLHSFVVLGHASGDNVYSLDYS
jgi:hypothetical protein